MSCPLKVNSNTIELGVHISCFCFLDLLCVIKKDLGSVKDLKIQINGYKEMPLKRNRRKEKLRDKKKKFGNESER